MIVVGGRGSNSSSSTDVLPTDQPTSQPDWGPFCSIIDAVGFTSSPCICSHHCFIVREQSAESPYTYSGSSVLCSKRQKSSGTF